MQHQIWKGDHNKKSLLSTEQHAVRKYFDLRNNKKHVSQSYYV